MTEYTEIPITIDNEIWYLNIPKGATIVQLEAFIEKAKDITLSYNRV